MGEVSDDLVGRTLDAGRYLVEAPLGAGGMGRVYQVRDQVMSRRVALKLLHRGAADAEDSRGRFVREARLVGKLQHPNTVRVFDLGSCEEGLYLTMELLHGMNLATWLKRDDGETIQSEWAALVAVGVARSLAEAHEQGIVHRDIKVSNIFLQRSPSEGTRVKVLDFGLAKVFEGGHGSGTDHFVTDTSDDLVGTLSYMSPEQIREGPLDARTDLYSLGIVLYRMLTGSVPFRRSTRAAIARAHIHDPPPPLPDSVPAPIAALTLQLLAKAPADRPGSAREVVRRLEAWLAEVGALLFDLDATAPAGADPAGPGTATLSHHDPNPSRTAVAPRGIAVQVGVLALVVAALTATVVGIAVWLALTWSLA